MSRSEGKEVEYVLLEKIGSGGFGEVWRAQHTPTQSTVAVKKVFLDVVSDRVFKMLEKECDCLRQFKHPSLIRCVDVFQSGDERYLYIVTEFYPKGDMLQYMLRHKKLSEHRAFRIFRRLVAGIEYMHNEGFCHRDLKLENMLLDQKGHIKICDFGFSTKWSPDYLLSEHPGSLHYSAPEIVKGEYYRGPDVDIWSMGVILYTMATGMLPFRSANKEKPDQKEISKKIVNAELEFPSSMSSELKALIQRMLDPSRKTRVRITQIKSSQWMMNMEMGENTKRSSKRSLSRHASRQTLQSSCPSRLSVSSNASNISNITMESTNSNASSMMMTSQSSISTLRMLASSIGSSSSTAMKLLGSSFGTIPSGNSGDSHLMVTSPARSQTQVALATADKKKAGS